MLDISAYAALMIAMGGAAMGALGRHVPDSGYGLDGQVLGCRGFEVGARRPTFKLIGKELGSA